jgi:hypothetical protein
MQLVTYCFEFAKKDMLSGRRNVISGGYNTVVGSFRVPELF